MTQNNEATRIDLQEERWVNETIAGNTKSYDNIITKYQDQVYNLILRTIRNRADTEDLVQNVFFNAFQSLKHFRKQSSLKTWLYSIAINQTRNYWRSHKYKSAYTESESIPLAETEAAFLHQTIDASGVYQQEETKRIVDDLISYLPPLQKEIFVFYYILGHSCDEIAEILHTSPANIKIQLFRGRKRLFEKFKLLFK